MIIQSCTFSLHFPPCARVREHLFDLEHHFQDFQKPFTLISLPAEAPMEIPRIIAKTEHHHSQLAFCGDNVQIVTNFDENYNTDIKKCIKYIHQKCKSIVASLPIINENSDGNPCFYYSGLTIDFSLDASDEICNPTAYITKKFLKCKFSLPTDEIQFRCALVQGKKYYVNIMLQNNRIFAGHPNERGSLAGLKVAKEDLRVILDVNDRYAFNHIENYFSSEKEVDQIAELAEIFSCNYLSDFLKNGEIHYDE